MKLIRKKSHLFILIVILSGVAFACIAPSIDWLGTPQLEDLTTKSANEFYLKVFSEQYHEIYVEADEELRNKTAENEFQNSLKTVKSKLTDNPISKRTECIWTRANSIWDRIKVNSNLPFKIKATCIFHNKEHAGTFIWRYVNGELKLVSFAESEKFKY